MAPLFPAPVALDARRRCSSFSSSSSSSPRLCPDPAAATSPRPSIFAAAPARLCSAPLLLYHGLPPSASRLHPSSPPQAAPSPSLAVPTSSRKPGAQALPWPPPVRRLRPDPAALGLSSSTRGPASLPLARICLSALLSLPASSSTRRRRLASSAAGSRLRQG